MKTARLFVLAWLLWSACVIALADAADRLQLIIEEDTPHRVNPEAIDAGIAWFTRWLRP
jgi:hypothetical protein